jgi:Mrp family chromosome partitioning ATPase
VLRAPLLGEIPDFGSAGVEGPMPTVLAPHSGVSEAYHFILAALDHVFDDDNANTIMLTSCKPNDGKTVTALNLAVAATVSGRRVVLVDGDKRRRGLTQIAGRGSDPGLAELADDPESPATYVSPMRVTEDQALAFVGAGRDVDDPAAFFRTARFRRALSRLRDLGELTIVDTPPLLAVADTSAIAAQADGIVVVVERGTPRALLEDLRHRLDFVGTPVLGYVFNRSDARRRRGGYGYGAYAYDSGDGGDGRDPRIGPVDSPGVVQRVLKIAVRTP